MKKLTQKIFKYHKLLLSILILATSTYSYSMSKSELFNKINLAENEQQIMDVLKEYGKSNNLTKTQFKKFLINIMQAELKTRDVNALVVMLEKLIQLEYMYEDSFDNLSVEKIIATGRINNGHISPNKKEIVHAWKGKVDIQPNKEDYNASYLITLNNIPNDFFQCEYVARDTIYGGSRRALNKIIINENSFEVKNFEEFSKEKKKIILKSISLSCNEKDNKITFVFH